MPGTPDPITGVVLPIVTDNPSPLATYVGVPLTSINNFLLGRVQQAFSWANNAGQLAQAGMVAGALGYQADIDTTFRYNGTAWKLWDKPWAAFTPTYSGITSTSPTVAGRYSISAGTVFVETEYTVGTSPTVTSIVLNLPTPADVTGKVLDSSLFNGVAVMDGGTTVTYFAGAVRLLTASTVRLMRSAAASPGVWAVTSASTPFSWAPTNRLTSAFNYVSA